MGILDWFLPEADRKFKTAKQMFDARNYSAAQPLFRAIEKEHSEAFPYVAECLYMMHPNKHSELHFQDCQKIIEWQHQVPGISNKATFQSVLAKSYLDAAIYRFHQATGTDNKSLSDLLENIDFIKKAQKRGLEKHFQKILEDHFLAASSIYGDDARKFERQGQFSIAAKSYQAAILQYRQVKNEHDRHYFELLMRAAICDLKQGKLGTPSVAEAILAQPTSSRELEDFCFRYAVLLLKNGQLDDSRRFVARLPPFHDSTRYLKEFLDGDAMRKAQARLNELNKQVQEVMAKDFPIPETGSIFETISSEAPGIGEVLPSIAPKLRALQQSLFSKLIAGCFAAKRYQDVFDLISRRPIFWESPELLKNLAGACVGLTSSHQLTPESYQLTISTWLTAVHQLGLFLHTIEQTNWHVDTYQFTLADGVGVMPESQSLASGQISDDAPGPSTVSIAVVQQNLLTAFEAELSRYPEVSLRQEDIQQCYEKEKSDFQSLFSVLPRSKFLAGPTFAHRFGCCHQIVRELNNAYNANQDELVLRAGLPYVVEDGASPVNRYSKAGELKNALLRSIHQQDFDHLLELMKEPGRTLLFSFGGLASEFEKSAIEWVAGLEEDESTTDELANFLIRLTGLFPEFENLTSRSTEIIMAWCLTEINKDEDSMPMFDGLEWFARIYHLNPGNSRICENLITLIKINIRYLMDEIAKNSKQVFAILDAIEANQSVMFRRRADKLAEFQDEVMDSLDAEQKRLIIGNTGLSDLGALWVKCLRYTATFSGKKLR